MNSKTVKHTLIDLGVVYMYNVLQNSLLKNIKIHQYFILDPGKKKLYIGIENKTWKRAFQNEQKKF